MVGLSVGFGVGPVVVLSVGVGVGTLVGLSVGVGVGILDVGDLEEINDFEGELENSYLAVGSTEGKNDGLIDTDGSAEGLGVGSYDGSEEGLSEGAILLLQQQPLELENQCQA